MIFKEVTVFKTNTFEPYRNICRFTQKQIRIPICKRKCPGLIQKLGRFIRGNMLFPMQGKDGIVRIKRKELIAIENFQCNYHIKSSSFLTVNRLKLKQETGLLWIADLRDPRQIFIITEINVFRVCQKKMHYKKNGVRKADHIITVGEDIKRIFLKKSIIPTKISFM